MHNLYSIGVHSLSLLLLSLLQLLQLLLLLTLSLVLLCRDPSQKTSFFNILIGHDIIILFSLVLLSLTGFIQSFIKL